MIINTRNVMIIDTRNVMIIDTRNVLIIDTWNVIIIDTRNGCYYNYGNKAKSRCNNHWNTNGLEL
jgi:hypothetical protein